MKRNLISNLSVFEIANEICIKYKNNNYDNYGGDFNVTNNRKKKKKKKSYDYDSNIKLKMKKIIYKMEEEKVSIVI